MLSLFDMLLSIGIILQLIIDVDNPPNGLYYYHNHTGCDYNNSGLKYAYRIENISGR